MRRLATLRPLLVIVPILLLGNGCATVPATGQRPSDTPTPSSSASRTPGDCATPAGVTITVTELDNGRTVCAAVTQRIEILLHGSTDRPWTAITANGDQLSPAGTGRMSLGIGVTGAAFTAVRPGEAEVTSTRRVCAPDPNGSACTAVVLFRVTVSVHS